MPIVGNIIGGIPVPPKSCLLKMSDGNEFHAVLVGSEVIFTADPNDIRKGKIAANASGPVSGTKVIPTYHTVQGIRGIASGSAITLPNPDSTIDNYDYTKLQVIVCAFNTNLNDSVSAEYVCIDDKMYAVQTVDSLSVITKNHTTKTIEFGITNNSGAMQIVRYFMYKEIE